MAEIEITGGLGSALMHILEAEEIQPGTDIGYELCKQLWQFHPLGGKLVEKPILMAMCKPRQYNVETDPDERVVRRFQEVWERMKVNEKIKNLFFCLVATVPQRSAWAPTVFHVVSRFRHSD